MILRSVLEGVAQAVSLAVHAVRDSGGEMPDTVPFIGGGSTNPVFAQLLADCAGRPRAHSEAPDAAVTGAALLGTGVTSNPHRPEYSSVTLPREEEMVVLASRRERLREIIATSRGKGAGATLLE